MERTLILVKPDGLQRALSGEIIDRLEKTGLKISGIKLLRLSEDIASKHYEEHTGKPFFEDLVNYICSGPIIAMVLEGPNAVEKARNIIGKTNPLESPAGTIRGDLGLEVSRNLIHGSANISDANREINIFFEKHE
ncbi:MAG: nucleoside-diphosphate kinase, partial [SAR202 cluster bacterium]|nr:nucleoside-diphosphate kinase [SAR202 cluster bacterium]